MRMLLHNTMAKGGATAREPRALAWERVAPPLRLPWFAPSLDNRLAMSDGQTDDILNVFGLESNSPGMLPSGSHNAKRNEAFSGCFSDRLWSTGTDSMEEVDIARDAMQLLCDHIGLLYAGCDDVGIIKRNLVASSSS